MENIGPVHARIVLRELIARGISSQELLQGTPLDVEALETGGDIPVEDFVTILENARMLSGDETLGLMIGRHTNLAGLGSVGTAMATAPTIREGLQALENYSRLHATYIGIELCSNLDGLSVGLRFLHELGEVERFHTEAGMMLAQNFMETVSGQPLDDAVFRFAFEEPPYSREYDACLHSPCLFNCDQSSIDVPRHWLEIRSPYYSADLWHRSQLELSRKIQELGTSSDQAYTQHLNSLLRSHEPPLPGLGSIASSLHLSERTLARRLNREGTSFREIRGQVLRSWARQYLLNTNDSVESIAVALGYQDAANFRRAFRSWENRSPGEYRKVPPDSSTIGRDITSAYQ